MPLPAGFVIREEPLEAAQARSTLPPGFKVRDDSEMAAPATSGSPGAPQEPIAEPAQETTQPATGADIAKSAGIGVAKGTIGLAGLPGDIREGVRGGAGWLAGKLGASDETAQRVGNVASYLTPPMFWGAPTSAGIQGAVESVTGPFYEPKSTVGEFAQTVGEFAPGAIAGPGGVLRKAAMTAIPGVLSEGAGQATKGTAVEPVARAAAGLAGGVATAGRAGNVVRQAANAAPTAEQVRATTNALYDRLRSAGIKYDADGFDNFVEGVAKKLDEQGFRPKQAPKATDAFDYMSEFTGRSPDFSDIESMRRTAGRLARDADATERAMGAILQGALDDFTQNAAFMTTGRMGREEVQALTAQAREMARRGIKGREVDEAIREAGGYQSGFESGLRNKFSNIMKNDRKFKSFTPEEQAAIRRVAKGTGVTHNLLGGVGRGGFDPGQGGSRQFLGPIITGSGGATFGGPLGSALALGGATAAKQVANLMTRRASQDLQGVVRAGREAQGELTGARQRERINVLLRQVLAGQGAQPLNELRALLAPAPEMVNEP